jgi:hypothetical protein
MPLFAATMCKVQSFSRAGRNEEEVQEEEVQDEKG